MWMIGILNFILSKYVFNPKNKIAECYSKIYVKFRKLRSIAVPAVFTLTLLVGFYNVILGKYVLFLIPFVMVFLGRLQRSEEKKFTLEM